MRPGLVVPHSTVPRIALPPSPARHGLMAAAGAVLAWLLFAARPAAAAELVMFERAGCPWCLRWEREIGPIYPLTDEGRRAPLRRVSLERPLPPGLDMREPVFYSPTFVLFDGGREIGRITGYAGEDAFWGLLKPLIARLGAAE